MLMNISDEMHACTAETGGGRGHVPPAFRVRGHAIQMPLPVFNNHHSIFRCNSEMDHLNKIHCQVRSVKRSRINCFKSLRSTISNFRC